MRTSLIVALFSLSLAVVAGCPKDDNQPPPIPSSAPTPVLPTPPPTQVEIVAEVDAGAPVEDAAAAAKKVTARPADVAGLKACCAAIKQNAASMPPPNNIYAESAAAVCQGLVAATASGAVSKTVALSQINAALKGAGMPPACR